LPFFPLKAVSDGAGLAAASTDRDFARLAARVVRAVVFLDFFTGRMEIFERDLTR
jgi:hypothetical protein